MKVGVVGPVHHSKILARQLEAEGIEAVAFRPLEFPPLNKIMEVDIIHGLFAFDAQKALIAGKILGRKTVCHWIGSDVYDAHTTRKHRLLAHVLNNFVDVHLTVSELLVNELKDLGINATVIPAVPEIESKPMPFPDRFTVLSYLPNDRHKFYGSETVYRLAREFPEIDFLILGNEEAGQEKPPNIRYLGWQDNMEEVYRKTTVLLRTPVHDGLSKMTLEALSAGRQVVYSYKFPHCHYAKTYDEVKEKLIEIKDNPKVNYEGAEYVKENFDSKNITAKLIKIYEDMTSK